MKICLEGRFAHHVEQLHTLPCQRIADEKPREVEALGREESDREKRGGAPCLIGDLRGPKLTTEG